MIIEHNGEKHTHDYSTNDSHITKCQKQLKKSECRVVIDFNDPDCPGCQAPAQPIEFKPSRNIKWGAKARNDRREDQETLKFAHVEIVASQEWLNRGEENQFLSQALDRAGLAVRFLEEFLEKHGRL